MTSRDEHFGRNRESIADLDEKLTAIFLNNPEHQLDSNGVPHIPAKFTTSVLRQLAAQLGTVLLNEAELEATEQFFGESDGDITPDVLLGVVAQAQAQASTATPAQPRSETPPREDDTVRGRVVGRSDTGPSSRSSSIDSVSTTYYRPEVATPKTPRTPHNAADPYSPFEAKRRQRSTPLENSAPSSWNNKRPVPVARRRKSDASSAGGRALSDTESSPSSHVLNNPRHRAPSNPTSPSGMSMSQPDFGSARMASPPETSRSRPPSRQASFDAYEPIDHSSYQYGSPTTQQDASGLISPPPERYSPGKEHPMPASAVSSVAMPKSKDDDDLDEEEVLGLVHDRPITTSITSITSPHEQIEALQKANADLSRRLAETSRNLNEKLSSAEADLADMELRLEECKEELSATKREEKELRSKERQNGIQISTLESEIHKLQKSLDNARASYQNLQKLYQDQCAESEKHRNTLRRRDQEIKDLEDINASHALEVSKWNRERDVHEMQLAQLEEELGIARRAQVDLDEQKQENLLLKETIDRLRFDLDELRTSAASATTQGRSSGSGSRMGSISRTLGVELAKKLESMGTNDDEESDEDHSGDKTPEADGSTEGEEEENVYQTIITRKRKVASRANRKGTVQIEEPSIIVKEYSDAETQYELSEFTSFCAVQTDPLPKPLISASSTQTEPEPELQSSFAQTSSPTLVAVQVQTELAANDVTSLSSVAASAASRPGTSSSHRHESDSDEMTSSSSTVRPTHDEPPAYATLMDTDRETLDKSLRTKVARDVMREWHHGMTIPLEPASGGVSMDTLENWNALKKELGMECMVIDKVIQMSQKTSERRALPEPGSSSSTSRRRSFVDGGKSRFYNIYNTYLLSHGAGKKPEGSGSSLNSFLLFGAGALAVFALTGFGSAETAFINLPGGPQVVDRTLWTTFNAIAGSVGAGFDGTKTGTGESADAVWHVVAQLINGSANIVRVPLPS